MLDQIVRITSVVILHFTIAVKAQAQNDMFSVLQNPILYLSVHQGAVGRGKEDETLGKVLCDSPFNQSLNLIED